jgi:hypothetical protein
MTTYYDSAAIAGGIPDLGGPAQRRALLEYASSPTDQPLSHEIDIDTKYFQDRAHYFPGFPLRPIIRCFFRWHLLPV